MSQAMPAPKCPRCRRLFSPADTLEWDGYTVAHVDCGRPGSLSPEEHVFLYVYCWDHAVAECVACAKRFRQGELAADPLSIRTYLCLDCHCDLTDSVRAHVLTCSTLPEQLRQRVRNAREVGQRLLKRSHQLVDRADVLKRELDATWRELGETRMRTRSNRDRH